MPQAADLVINDAAAVAKTFTLLSPAAGYGSAALWALKEGAISAVFPRLGSSSKRSANKASKVDLSVRVPSSYVDAASGITKVGSSFDFHGYATIPDDFPEALKADAVAYVTNFIAHALIQAQLSDGTPMS